MTINKLNCSMLARESGLYFSNRSGFIVFSEDWKIDTHYNKCNMLKKIGNWYNIYNQFKK